MQTLVVHLNDKQSTPITKNSDKTIRSIMQLADEQLLEGPHDVFITRNIFSQLQDSSQLSFAQELFSIYEEKFNSKKKKQFISIISTIGISQISRLSRLHIQRLKIAQKGSKIKT